MDSQFQQYSITFSIKEDKVDIFKTIIRFLDHLTRDYDMGMKSAERKIFIYIKKYSKISKLFQIT